MSLQHLIDLQGFGNSDRIFATGGGYAQTGAYLNSWEKTPVEELPKQADVATVAKFLRKLFKHLKCS